VSGSAERSAWLGYAASVWPLVRRRYATTKRRSRRRVCVSGFKSFLLKTNALALAVGVIIGVAMGNVVNSLVNDVIMPPVGMLMGNLDFSQMKVVLKATGDPKTEVAIRYGAFINVVIAFVIVAVVVYVITSVMLRAVPATPEPPTKECPFCKESVPADATKCRACTSAI
jgi:large conductance mechanosensitive channel